METYLYPAQIIISFLLAICILLQNKGAGLSEVFGGSGNVYTTKRGAEKILFRLTVLLAILFMGNATLFLVLPYIS